MKLGEYERASERSLFIIIRSLGSISAVVDVWVGFGVIKQEMSETGSECDCNNN